MTKSKKGIAGIIALMFIFSVFIGLIPLTAASPDPDEWMIGYGGDNWVGNSTSINSTIVQATNYSELEDFVPDYVSKWRFDSNTTVDENTTNSNDGTRSGVTYNASGKYGEAFDFDGTNDYIDCGNDASFNITGNLTITAWIYPVGWGQNNMGRIVDKGTSAYLFFIDDSLDIARFYASAGAIIGEAGMNSITLNEWQHVAVTYNRVNTTFYVNGILSGTPGADTDAITTSSAVIHIGSRSGQATERNFNGTIDDVRIYNRSLSNAEINQTRDNNHYIAGNRTSIINDLGINKIAKQIRVKGNNPRVGTNLTVAVNVSEFNTSFVWEEVGTITTVGEFNVTYDIAAMNQKRYVGWNVYYQTNDSTNTSILYNTTILYETNIAPEIREVITTT